jgi:hypothetical protein
MSTLRPHQEQFASRSVSRSVAKSFATIQAGTALDVARIEAAVQRRETAADGIPPLTARALRRRGVACPAWPSRRPLGRRPVTRLTVDAVNPRSSRRTGEFTQKGHLALVSLASRSANPDCDRIYSGRQHAERASALSRRPGNGAATVAVRDAAGKGWWSAGSFARLRASVGHCRRKGVPRTCASVGAELKC